MATLSMEAMRATMLGIGTHFYPLRHLDDAVEFLWAVFKYPAGLPNRVPAGGCVQTLTNHLSLRECSANGWQQTGKLR